MTTTKHNNQVSRQLTYLWARFHSSYPWVADDSFFGSLNTALHKLIVDLFLNKASRPSQAALAHIEEDCVVRSFYSLIQVAISKDDVGTFASQLHLNALQVCSSRSLLDDLAHFRRSSEGNFGDIGMLTNASTRSGTETRDHVENTGREA